MGQRSAAVFAVHSADATCRWRIARSTCARWAACQGAAVAENRSTAAFQTPQAQGGFCRAAWAPSTVRPTAGTLAASAAFRTKVRFSLPFCGPLLLLDPNPALIWPPLARSPDLPAEPEAPFGTIAARYFAAHRPHPCAQPSCRTPTHSKKPLVGRSQLLSLSHHHFPRAHFRVYLGRGGAAAVEGADPHSVQGAHQYA